MLAEGRRRSRTDIPALPFCHVHCRVRKPSDPPDPAGLRTLGDHLRRRRLDLGLLRREAAARLGAHVATLANWEVGRAAPALWFYPAILVFLEYDPRPPAPGRLGQQLQHHRRGRGLTQAALAHQLGVDPGTLARWEHGTREPAGKFAAKAEAVLASQEKTVPDATGGLKPTSASRSMDP